jgi:hypothetical protein
MSGFSATSVHNCFAHSTAGENGMVESLCLFCGRCAGYSHSEEFLAVVEKVHRCAGLVEFESSQQPAG